MTRMLPSATDFRRPATARAAFTLTELLVVIAIMAILVSLTAAAIFRVRATQMENATQATMQKVQSGVDTHIQQLNGDVAREKREQTPLFKTLYAYCNNDGDRAEALLAYCRVTQAFPQSFAELASTMTAAPLVGQPGFTVGGVNFPWSPAFRGLTPPTGATAEVESAILLYAAISKRTIAGATFGGDEAMGNAQGTWTDAAGVSHQVFLDAWKKPIGLSRFYESAELDRPEYTNAKTGLMNRFDPSGKLATWSNAANKSAAETALRVAFNNRNKQVIVFSWGPNEGFENLAGDDLLSFRFKAIGK